MSSLATSAPSAAGPAGAEASGRPAKPSRWRGLLLAAVLAAVAWGLGMWQPMVGGPVFGILLGILWRNTRGVGPECAPGLAYASKQGLQAAIIALGFGLSLQQVLSTGLSSLPVMLGTLFVALFSAWLLGRWMGVNSRMTTLIGVGTAICGGTAIAAVAPIVRPRDHELVVALSVIFLFNVVAVLSFPAIGHALDMSQASFGLWAGTAINDTSSVVAAGYIYGQEAGDYATMVKLTRTTMIIPFCLILVLLANRRDRREGTMGERGPGRMFPWFIAWFLVAAALRSLGLVPEELLVPLQWLAKGLITLALTAIGLSCDIRQLANAGWRPAAMGLGAWVAASLTSLGLQNMLGAW